MFSTALNPTILHRMHVCVTFFSVEMQIHITCRWSGSAPFVTSLTRVRAWTQLINTKRCQCALDSWLRCTRLPLFPSHLVRPQRRKIISDALTRPLPPTLSDTASAHPPFHPSPLHRKGWEIPLCCRGLLGDGATPMGDDSTLHWSVHVGAETLFIRSKLPLTAQICSQWEFHTSLSYILSISPILGVIFVSQLYCNSRLNSDSICRGV